MNVEKRVCDWMRQQNMVCAGESVVVALSGGKDSVCLLVILDAIRNEMGISLQALHVHHGIRGKEADRDARFSEALCREKQIPFETVHVDVPAMAAAKKLSMEEAAREARYEALEAYRSKTGAEHIAVAHHQNDNAETVLWNLFRGSGLRGIGGIRPVNGRIIRPLLGLSQSELDLYAEEKGLTWCEDSTNETDHYTRNRIRRHLIPLITEEVNGQAVAHICQTAALASEADRYLREQAVRWLGQPEHMRRQPPEGEAAGLELDAGSLASEDRLLQTYVIREACRMLGCQTDLGRSHVEAVRSLLTDSRGASAHRQVSLIHGMQARRDYDRLIFRLSGRDLPHRKEGWGEKTVLLPLCEWELNRTYEVSWCGKTFKMRLFAYNKTEKNPSNRYTKWLNYDKMSGSLVLRSRKTGDYIGLNGGGTKTVKAYMVDEKIPAESRDAVPVLADGNHVLWIVGYRISERAKVTLETERVLEITMYGGEKDGNSSRVDFGTGCEPPDCQGGRTHQ